MLETLLVVLTLLQSASSLQLNVHHRLLEPSRSSLPPQFTYKGTIDVDSTILSSIQASYSPSNAHEHDLSSFLSVADDASSALYQVAIELPEVNRDSWPFTSVNACHWHLASGERFWLHVSPTGIPYSLSYWLVDLPNDGACPIAQAMPRRINMANWNTTVIIKSPASPPSPQLRVPPTLTPEGAPVEPEAEKSFIQKYWMYLIGAFLLITIVLPAPEEPAQGQQGGGASSSK